MELAPQAYRAQVIAFRQRLVGEVAGDFFGREIDIGENHHARLWLFDNLRSPPGLAASIKSFATLEAHRFESRDEMRKGMPARAIRVVVMIRPTEAQTVLAFVLYGACPVAILPIFALSLEKQ